MRGPCCGSRLSCLISIKNLIPTTFSSRPALSPPLSYAVPVQYTLSLSLGLQLCYSGWFPGIFPEFNRKGADSFHSRHSEVEFCLCLTLSAIFLCLTKYKLLWAERFVPIIPALGDLGRRIACGLSPTWAMQSVRD